MSKRSRMKKRQESRLDQQVSLSAKMTAPEGANRPSIAQLVLQRMDRLGVIQQVAASTHVQIVPEKPSIKIASVPNGAGMPVVSIPKQQEPAPKQEPVPKQWPQNWPVCPKTCDETEWYRALDNKEYYELKMIEDDGKKPWFQYPRYPWQYSEFVYCTPEMMQALLAHMPINRPCKEPWVDAISRDVSNERWIQSHESIAINKLGNMHDGQHRAKGVIKAGRGWPIYITWNVPPEAIYVTDSGDKRKINEKLALLFPDSKLTPKTAALCRSMMWGLSSRSTRYSESEIAEFAVKHQQILVWVAANLRGYRADLQAVIGKALLWWGESVISPFVERLKTITFTGEGDPAKALYLWLQKAKSDGRKASYANPLVYYKKTLSAVDSAVNSKNAKKIYQKDEDVFDWEAGWNVPASAPCAGNCLISKPVVSETTAENAE